MLFSPPNILTMFRIALIPAIVAAFYIPGDLGHWIALGLFVAAGLSDFLDGYLARAMNLTSRFGQLMDPIADKLVVAAALLMLVHNDTIGDISIVAAIIILCREMLVSGLREFLASAKVSLPVTALAKWKTTVQMVAIGFLLFDGPVFGLVDTHVWGGWLIWMAAVLTVWSMVYYLQKALPEIRARGL
jgi:CDP-diacylglycerol--glycerol-3-phosphate 3-phosphatidyltransferase